jgi:hypothetical protein
MESQHQIVKAPPHTYITKTPRTKRRVCKKENEIIGNWDTRLSNMVIS